MQIRCPVCDYSREVNLAKVPPTAEFATCPKCRHRFRFRAVDLDAVESAAPPEPKPEHADVWDAVDSLHDRWAAKDRDDADGQSFTHDADAHDGGAHDDEGPAGHELGYPGDVAIPWENPAYLGYWQSFLRTTLWVLFQPASFFATLSRRPALLPALAYYLIFGFVQYVLNVVWTHFLGSMLQERLIENMGEEMYMRIAGDVLENSLFTVAVISVPFQLAIQLFIAAGLVHLMIKIVHPYEADFTLSFKVAAYASAGFALALVPVVGVLVGPVLYFVLLVIGCRNAFNMTWPKTLMALVPLMFLLLFASLAQYSQYVGA